MTDYEAQQKLRDMADYLASYRYTSLIDFMFEPILADCRKRRKAAILKATKLVDCA